MRTPTHLNPFRRLPAWALGLFGLCFAAPLWAQPAGVSTGGCEVLKSGLLDSSDYVFRYQGGCKNGVAEGQGTATWRLSNAPDLPPVQWKGRFSQGIFLAEPQTVGAKRIDSARVLLDLGPLPAPPGAQTGRLWAESRFDGKNPASACQPQSLAVSANGKLADDALAKGWLDKAYARWQAICPTGTSNLKNRFFRLTLYQGTDWSVDRFGNFPTAVVEASKSFGMSSTEKASDWANYRNLAARQQADQQRDAQKSAALQANQDRIRAFARKTGAHQLVTLGAIEANPFRFGQQVILVAIRITAARTPTEAAIQPARDADPDDWSFVVLRGAIADWDDQGRIAAVRVKGRSTESPTKYAAVLELVASQRCQESNCEDYLLMPGNHWLRDEAISADATPSGQR